MVQTKVHKFLSTFLLTGPYDTNLNWLLRKKFTISLLNQVKNNTHHTCPSTWCIHFKIISTDSASSHSTTEYVCESLISMQSCLLSALSIDTTLMIPYKGIYYSYMQAGLNSWIFIHEVDDYWMFRLSYYSSHS